MASVDSLSILITASTTSAVKKIDALTESLYYLKEAINRLDVSKFETLASATQSLSQGLSGLKGAGVKQIEKAAKALDNVSTKETSFEAVAKGAEKLAVESKETAQNIDEVSNSFGKFDSTSIDGMAQSMEKVSQTVDNTMHKMSSFKSLLAKTRIIIPTEGLDKVNSKIEKLTEKIEDMQDRLNFKSQTQADYVNSEEMEKDKQKIEGLINELDRLKLKKEELESHGGFKLNLGATISNLAKGFETVNKKLDSFISKMRSAKTHTKDTSKATNDFSISSMKLAKELTRVTKMLKLMVTRMVLRKVIQGVVDGFKNLIQYSDSTNAAVSMLWNSFRQLGNSIAAAVNPLLSALAPALNYLIQLCIKLVNAINQVISALLGKGTWTKAKQLSDDYGASLDKSNKSAKELKRTILGFDEINQLQENKDSGSGGGTSPSDMFEEAAIEDRWQKVADYLKNLAKRLFEPIKKAWEKVGDFVKKSWKYAMDEVLKLGKSVARDFWKVWEQKETQKIFENILETVGWIGQTVGNLAKRFREAWDANKTGLQILQNIRDIVLIVTERIRNMAKATAEWADNLNFEPLLNAFRKWLESMKPVIDNITGAFEDFYRKVLLPLGEWTIEKGLPELIDVFRRFNEEVEWETIRERLNRVWEALEPFAETVGEGLIKFIDKISSILADFLNSDEWDSFIDSLIKWMNSVDADDVARGLELICTALLGYAALSGTMTVLAGVSTFLTKMAAIGSKVAAAFRVIYEAMKLVAGFMASPEWVAFVDFLQNPASVVSISAIIDLVKGTFLDPDEWTGWIGELVDKLGILLNDLATVLGSPILFVNTLLEGGTVQDYCKAMDDAWQSIDKYNAAVQKLKEYNLDTSGSYDEIIYRANNLSNTMGHVSTDVKKSSTVVSGAAKTMEDKTKGSFVNVSAGAATLYRNVNSSNNDIKKSFGELEITVKKDTTSISNTTNSVNFNDFVKTTGKMKDDVSIEFENVDIAVGNSCETMTGTVHDLTKTVDDSSNDIISATDRIKSAFDENEWTFSGVADGLRDTFERAKDAIKDVWNSIADKLNGDFEIGSTTLHIKLPKFATGGFPKDDSLFLANSTEMVGKFSNGQNVVANNQQITEGIAQAVYSAIMSANTSGGNAQYINNTIQIDGETIARAVTKGQKSIDRRYSPTMA